MGYSTLEFESLYKGKLEPEAEILSLECFEEYREEYNKIIESEKTAYDEKIRKEKEKWKKRAEKYREEHPWVETEEYAPEKTFEQYVMPDRKSVV